MSEDFAEIIELAEKAQAKGVFSLAEAIRGNANPSDDVEVFLDVDSAYKLTKLNNKIIQTVDEEELKVLEAEAKEYADKILASKVVFHMRGVDQAMIESIEEATKAKYKDEDENWWAEYLCALVASNIVSVENSAGEFDQHVFTTEEVTEIRNTIPAESWEKILGTMQRLTLATGYFKGLTDAGFLQKS